MAEGRETEIMEKIEVNADQELPHTSENKTRVDDSDQARPHASENNTHVKKSKLHKVGQRIRDPFNKKKVKELKQIKRELENTVEKHIKQLIKVISTHQHGQILIGTVDSLQVDCINEIHQSSEKGLPGIQEQIDKLTDSANKLLEELTAENERKAEENTEIKHSLERSEMKLEELKDLVSQCLSKISQQDTSHSPALKDLKDFQEAMLKDIPDDKVVSDGIEAIRLGVIFDEEYEFLPSPAKHLVTRLVHLFGQRGLVTLCEALHMNITDDIAERGYNEGSITNNRNNELILNNDVCAKIIVHWINKSLRNDDNALLEILHLHERQRYLQIKEDFSSVRTTVNVKYMQTVTRDECLTQCQSLSSSLMESSRSSEKSLSIDENYYTYSPLEMDALHLLKVLSVEGIAA